jgi:nitrogenase iron protein NifH
VICNSAGDEAFERAVLAEFAEMLGTSLIALVPRSPVIQVCEVEGKTVLQHSPQAPEVDVFRDLADCVLENTSRVIPTPFEQVDELEAVYRRHVGQQVSAQPV